MKRITFLVTLIILMSFTVIYLGAATHTVKKGDTLSGIAKQYGITLSQLKEMNNLSSNTIKIGQVLKVEEDFSEDLDEDDWYVGEDEWYAYEMSALEELFGVWYGNPELKSLTDDDLNALIYDDVPDEDLSPEHICEWFRRKISEQNPSQEAIDLVTVTCLSPDTFDQAIRLTTRADMLPIKEALLEYKPQMLAHRAENEREWNEFKAQQEEEERKAKALSSGPGLFDLEFGMTRAQVKSTLAKNNFAVTGSLDENSLFYGNKAHQFVEFIIVSFESDNKLRGWAISYKSNVTKLKFASVCEYLTQCHGTDYRVEEGNLIWNLANNRTCVAEPAGGN